MLAIDLNCDLGEGHAADEELMPLISSANIACGGHAGDGATMRRTVDLALRHHVGIGAHPGYADREHFGRRELVLSAKAIRDLVSSQVAWLREMGPVRHVKPHGALYNQAAREPAIAQAVAAAVQAVSAKLILVGLAGSALLEAGRTVGLPVASEVFADRRFTREGRLVPRGTPDAMIHHAADAVAQVRRIVRQGRVAAVDGTLVPVSADTICLHGDGAGAVEFALQLRRALEADGIAIRRMEAAPC